ncbi:MAG: hypothetical protein HWE34_10010 [Methylocystaceae bacterium]|nr:hypothetical protein [Methylocystaceae bacterium]
MVKILALFSLILVTACTYPHTKTETVDNPATLVFTGASPDAMVYLNDLMIGPAHDYNGDPDSLIVPRGTHMLEIRENGTTILTEKIFVSNGSVKTFRLTGAK